MHRSESEELLSAIATAMKKYDRLSQYTVRLGQGSDETKLAFNIDVDVLDSQGQRVRTLYFLSARALQEWLLPAMQRSSSIVDQVFVIQDAHLVLVMEITGATIAEAIERLTRVI